MVILSMDYDLEGTRLQSEEPSTHQARCMNVANMLHTVSFRAHALSNLTHLAGIPPAERAHPNRICINDARIAC
jgi:hypothetical protein